MKGFQVEPTNAPIVKSISITRLDKAAEKLCALLVVTDEHGNHLTPQELAGLIWMAL